MSAPKTSHRPLAFLDFLASKVFSFSSPLPGAKGIGKEINASLPFQIAIYFNAWFYPVWAIGMLVTVRHKMLYFDPSFFYTFLMNFMLAVGLVIEPLRLWLGFSGNLRERVPELTGCFLFSLFPQVIIAVYFLMLQPMAGYGFITALEVSLNSVLLIFLIAESVLGYLAAKRSVRMQTANFFLKMKASEEDDDELLKKGNVSHRSKVMDQRRNALSWSSLESFW